MGPPPPPEPHLTIEAVVVVGEYGKDPLLQCQGQHQPLLLHGCHCLHMVKLGDSLGSWLQDLLCSYEDLLSLGMDFLWHNPVQAQVLQLIPPVLVLDGQLEPNGIHVHLHLEVGPEASLPCRSWQPPCASVKETWRPRPWRILLAFGPRC